MPTYEYLCDACEHRFDEFQSFSEKPLKKCPECKKPKLRRLFGCGTAVLFKGSGFYETDYRSESYKAAAKADTESTGKPSDGGTASKNGTSEPAAAPKPEKGKASGSKNSKTA
jgi:putative FmdB family regulatory protein